MATTGVLALLSEKVLCSLRGLLGGVMSLVVLSVVLLLSAACVVTGEQTPQNVEFTDDGRLVKPSQMNWIVVGVSASALAAGESGAREGTPEPRFNIVQIDPDAWRVYQASGVFPEGTMLVMSSYTMNDMARDAGRYWADELLRMEVSIKDSARFPDGWAYFRFDGTSATATPAPRERCLVCHEERAEFDNVFTQLYRVNRIGPTDVVR